MKLYNDAATNTIPTAEKVEHHSTSTVTNASSQTILKSCAPPFSIEPIADGAFLYTGFEDYHTLIICFNLLGPSMQYWILERQWKWS